MQVRSLRVRKKGLVRNGGMDGWMDGVASVDREGGTGLEGARLERSISRGKRAPGAPGEQRAAGGGQVRGRNRG